MHEDPALRNLPPSRDAATAGHEVADITLGGIRNFGIILFGTIIITLIAMSGLLWGYVKYQDAINPAASDDRPVPVPPEPMLQPSRYHNTLDATDLIAFHDEEKQKLSMYAWIGDSHKTARIPIERAMDMLLAKGFPARKGAPAASNSLVPTPTGGAAGIMNNAANPLDHAPPIAEPVPTGIQ